MMKSGLNQLFRDLNAAILLQRSEAVDIALDGLLRLQGVSGNEQMSDGFIAQVVLPVGQRLSSLQASILRPLLNHPLVFGRAIGAVALAHRFFKAEDTKMDDLRQGATDPRSDARLSLGRVLVDLAEEDPERLFDIGKSWLEQPSPRLRQTALIFLPHLAGNYGTALIDLLRPFSAEEHREVNRALADGLIQLGNRTLALPILHLLSDWSKYPSPNEWVICQTLSASWVVNYPSEVVSILKRLVSDGRESKAVSNTIKALKRNGLIIDLNHDIYSQEK